MRGCAHRATTARRLHRALTASRVYSAVCFVAFAAYLNGLGGDFVHDDVPAISHNRDALGISATTELFLNDFWGTPMSDPGSHKSYRPLTTLSFRANCLMSGLQPTWFHLVNVCLHATASLLFTRVCLAVAGLQPSFAAIAGLLFAAHPIHTEAVTGVVGRADVLACVFFLLSFLAYHGRGDQVYVWLSVLLAAVSMLAKETGVTVLLVNLVYDVYRSWQPIKKTLTEVKWNEETWLFARRAAKVLMSLSLLLVFRLALLQGSLPRFSNQDNPAAFHPCRHVRLLTFCYLAAFNCWLLLCPLTLSHDWQMGSVPLVTSLADSRNLGTCLLFGCCLLLAYRGLADFEQQRHPPLVLGCLLLVLPFLPAANLAVTVGFVVAERVLYIPSLGFVLLVVYGAQLLWTTALRQRSLLLCAGFLLLLLAFCSRTVIRNRDWTSRETLIRAGLRALPHNAKMHYNFANFQRDSSNLELATSHYKEALRLWPTYASAHNNLGTLMSSTEEAESHFLAAIRYSPNHVNAHYNLGQVYRKVNRTSDAVRMLERCVVLDASYAPAYLLLARLYSGPGSSLAVGKLLHHVTKLQPSSAEHLSEYAAWLHGSGLDWEALKYYQRALSLVGTHRTSLIGASKVLRSKGQWPRIHQLMIRYHIMSREHRGGVVYTGDLYIRGWKLENESPYQKELQVASRRQHQEIKHFEKSLCTGSLTDRGPPSPCHPTPRLKQVRSPRRNPRSWRRPAVNRTIVLRPGSLPETSCSLTAEFSSRVDQVGWSSGTGSYIQGYHYSYWNKEQTFLPSEGPVALHIESSASMPVPSERDVFCLSSFPETSSEEDFSPEFMTG